MNFFVFINLEFIILDNISDVIVKIKDGSFRVICDCIFF